MPREHDDIYKNDFYSYNQPAWHKKGIVGQEKESAVKVYSRMTPVLFDQRPFTINLSGKTVSTGKHYGIVRVEGTKEDIIGETKGRYNLTQPKRYAEIFDEYVGRYVETMGFLGTKGQKLFLTWVLPKIDVHGDVVESYGFFTTGFDGKLSEKLYNTHVRVVCRNTYSRAIREGDANGGATFTSKHTQLDHEERLGIWMRYMTQKAEEEVSLYQALFCKMEETPIDVTEAYKLFKSVYPYNDDIGEYYPGELRTKDQKRIDEFNKGQEAKRDLAVELFKGKGIEISRTLWGAFNAVTELENHHIPSKKDTTESVLVGNRQVIMEKALSVMRKKVLNQV